MRSKINRPAPMNNLTKITLGSLLSSTNETIRRNAVSILKQLQKSGNCVKNTFTCPYCGSFEVEIADGINGSDHITCKNCLRKVNIFEDDTE